MILLLYPKHSLFSHSISTPLSIFCLGSYIEQKGGKVEYFDERLQNWDYLFQLLNKKPLFVGISTMTSYQIKRAIAVASLIRRSYPDIPLVWGGVHPTMCPSQTAESELVDFIIKGEGEEALYDLANELASCRPRFDLLKNLVWKENGRIRENSNREFVDVNRLPFPYSGKAQDMLRLYLNLDNPWENIVMETSRGCNFGCRFCYNHFFNRFTCRTKNKEKLNAEFHELKKTGVREVMLADDNLGASYQHILNFCDIAQKYGIRWSSDLRVDIVDEELIKKLERSGCKSLFFGIESVNPEIIKYISKNIKVEKVNQVIHWISKTSITAIYSFMSGFPQDDSRTLREQIDFIDNLHKIDSKAEVAVQPFNPLPGTPLFQEAISLGFKMPQGLLDWWRKSTGDGLGPWVKEKALLRNLYLISILAFRRQRFISQLIYLPLHKIALMRWKKRFFRLCWERYLYLAIIKICIFLDSLLEPHGFHKRKITLSVK